MSSSAQTTPPPTPRKTTPGWWKHVSAAVLLLVLVLTLQRLSGAYESDLGAHPDEPTHFVTGLLVRDYLVTGIPRNPMAFARDYYDHYPKVALGHYPPVFYLLQAAWTLPFTPAKTSILLFMAVLSASFAYTVFFILNRAVGFLPGLMGSLLCAALPVVQLQATQVMSDLPLAIFCLFAALAFARYLETERLRDAVLFGLLASAATLTKGSGLLLALVPPLAIAFARRIELVRRLSFWMPALIVAVLCGPWMVATYHITREGMMDQSPLEYVATALPYYVGKAFHVFGFALPVFAVAGAILRANRTESGKIAFAPGFAACLALLLAVLAFYFLVPAGFDPRYLLPAAPALIILAVAGASSLSGMMREKWNTAAPLLTALPFALLLGLFLVKPFHVVKKHFRGYTSLVERLLAESESNRHKILVSSDARGEGAVIATIAMKEKRPGHRVERASKLLSESDWLGRHYKLKAQSPEAVTALLKKRRIRWIITDGSIPKSRQTRHWQLLADTLKNSPENFRLIAEFPIQRKPGKKTRTACLYRRNAP